MSAATTMRPARAAIATVSSAGGDRATPQQEARAALLAAIEVGSKEARRLHDLAEHLADGALEISLLAQRIAAEAVRLDEQVIDFACEYGKRVAADEEPCSCCECTGEVFF